MATRKPSSNKKKKRRRRKIQLKKRLKTRMSMLKMEPVVLTKEDHQEQTIEAVEMDNQEEAIKEVAVEAQNIITAVVNTGAEDVEATEKTEMVTTDLM